MTSRKIARDYLAKVEARLEALRLFLARARHDDVIREAHEAMELLIKGALRFVGVDPHPLLPRQRLNGRRINLRQSYVGHHYRPHTGIYGRAKGHKFYSI